MAEHCDHKFIDSNYCAKCGVSVAELSGDQRSSRTAPPRAELSAGAEMWRTTLERALTASRRHNIEARNLIRVLQQHASDDHLRARIRAWLDGDDLETGDADCDLKGAIAKELADDSAPAYRSLCRIANLVDLPWPSADARARAEARVPEQIGGAPITGGRR